MLYFWFILFLITFVINVRLHSRIQKNEKYQEAIISSLAVIIIENKVKPKTVALHYLYNLDNTLIMGDYRKFMGILCNKYGLVYRSDDGYLLADDVRNELADRLGKIFSEIHKSFKAREHIANTGDIE